MSFNDVFIVEVFAGKARLSRALRARGFQVLSIDHVATRGVGLLLLDLSCAKHQRIFNELLSQNRILYVHFAPPCGTASLARTIRMGSRHGPPPLRSLKRPMGLRRLTPTQAARVAQANALYQLTCDAILALTAKHVGWSVENPSSSLMWMTTPFARLQQQLRRLLLGFTFHTCAFQAPRKKQTAIWCSVQELLQLAKQCDGSHDHLPWGLTLEGTFATAEECAYNSNLCSHWAECIVQYALRLGLKPCPSMFGEVSDEHSHHKDLRNRATLGTLPRGNKLPPLLTDFLQTLACLDLHTRLPGNSTFPPGTRILAFQNGYGGNGCEATATGIGISADRMSKDIAFDRVSKDMVFAAEKVSKDVTKWAVLGVPLEPLEYVARACQLVHPELQNILVSDAMAETVRMHAPEFLVELKRLRPEWSRWALASVQQNRESEAKGFANLGADMQLVLKGKRFLVLREALEVAAYEDVSIATEAAAGFPLVGWMPATNVFASKLRPPQMHVAELENMAAAFNGRTLSTVKPSGDAELDDEVWAATNWMLVSLRDLLNWDNCPLVA